jgi:hypothetical protein
MRKYAIIIAAAVILVIGVVANVYSSCRAQAADANGNLTTSVRKSEQFKKWHWYELSDAQAQKMTVALTAIKKRQTVNVLCGDPDCRDLAKDFVDAFDGAGWTAHMISSGFVGNDIGLHCSDKPVCDAITKATEIRAMPFPADAIPPGVLTIMFGPKK